MQKLEIISSEKQFLAIWRMATPDSYRLVYHV